MESQFIVLLTIFCNFQNALSKLFTFEVEQFSPTAMRMPRSGASGNFTVHFHHGDLVHIEFCLRVASSVTIWNIIYSNDGPADTIGFSIDGQYVGTFNTSIFQNDGKGWNAFKHSGPIAGKVTLDVGKHVLAIQATQSDKWGVEIDNVLFNIDDNVLSYEDIVCSLYCFDIKYEDVPRKDSIPSGKFVQKSTSTQCTEQDNIKVEIYHDTSNTFEIIANLPKYVSFSNSRHPNYDRCILASPYWVFRNQTISPTQPDVLSGIAVLRSSGSLYRTIITISFNFDSLTPTRELDEQLIGSVLFVKLRNMPRENVKVKPEYLKDGRWMVLRAVEFTPFDNKHKWVIPDRTWGDAGENRIKLLIEPGKQQVIIDTVNLYRRNTTDTIVELYADPDVVFQGVRLGFWQHWVDRPNSMTAYVYAAGGSSEYFKIDSLQVYVKVPWTGRYAQVFVMFQDGRIRLQAITPHGLDYVPFGSSINIGQPVSTSHERPYSPINRITVDPKGMQIAVMYVDGNRATFELRTTYTQTKLIVKHANFMKNRRMYPIMNFQSMWIRDGNADTDHVTINGDISRHITSKWKELYGISAVFFRKCISQHNTQAPDITIRFLSKADV